MDIYDLNIYEGRLRYADRTPKNRSFEKKKSVEKAFFSSEKIDHLKKNRPKKSVILKKAEKSAQIRGYNRPKRVINPPYNPP